MTLSEWWNTTSWKTIDYDLNEFFDNPNMRSYGENLGVQDYDIVDFYDKNTTVSYFFEIRFLNKASVYSLLRKM